MVAGCSDIVRLRISIRRQYLCTDDTFNIIVGDFLCNLKIFADCRRVECCVNRDPSVPLWARSRCEILIIILIIHVFVIVVVIYKLAIVGVSTGLIVRIPVILEFILHIFVFSIVNNNAIKSVAGWPGKSGGSGAGRSAKSSDMHARLGGRIIINDGTIKSTSRPRNT
jgi:hypothetical protein